MPYDPADYAVGGYPGPIRIAEDKWRHYTPHQCPSCGVTHSTVVIEALSEPESVSHRPGVSCLYKWTCSSCAYVVLKPSRSGLPTPPDDVPIVADTE